MFFGGLPILLHRLIQQQPMQIEHHWAFDDFEFSLKPVPIVSLIPPFGSDGPFAILS